jgi:hypothetical protein
LQDISAANAALQGITAGLVGLDTEFTDPPIAPNEEACVMDPWVYKKLCVVQLAVQGTVFVIAVKAMKGEFMNSVRMQQYYNEKRRFS